MSALGGVFNRALQSAEAMSALGPKADIVQ